MRTVAALPWAAVMQRKRSANYGPSRSAVGQKTTVAFAERLVGFDSGLGPAQRRKPNPTG